MTCTSPHHSHQQTESLHLAFHSYFCVTSISIKHLMNRMRGSVTELSKSDSNTSFWTKGVWREGPSIKKIPKLTIFFSFLQEQPFILQFTAWVSSHKTLQEIIMSQATVLRHLPTWSCDTSSQYCNLTDESIGCLSLLGSCLAAFSKVLLLVR